MGTFQNGKIFLKHFFYQIRKFCVFCRVIVPPFFLHLELPCMTDRLYPGRHMIMDLSCFRLRFTFPTSGSKKSEERKEIVGREREKKRTSWRNETFLGQN